MILVPLVVHFEVTFSCQVYTVNDANHLFYSTSILAIHTCLLTALLMQVKTTNKETSLQKCNPHIDMVVGTIKETWHAISLVSKKCDMLFPLYQRNMTCYFPCIKETWHAISLVSKKRDMLFPLYQRNMTCYFPCIKETWHAISLVSKKHDMLFPLYHSDTGNVVIIKSFLVIVFGSELFSFSFFKQCVARTATWQVITDMLVLQSFISKSLSHLHLYKVAKSLKEHCLFLSLC